MLFRVVGGSNHEKFEHRGVLEYLGISPPITGRPLSSLVMSSKPLSPTLPFSTGHSANLDDFKILSFCFDTCELIIQESLLIPYIQVAVILVTLHFVNVQ